MSALRLSRVLHGVGQPIALAIGNFDGVHVGHAALLARTAQAADQRELVPAAMSFEPLPREYFAVARSEPALAPPRLMSASEKLVAFVQAGVRHAYLPRFDATFAAQSPDQFAAALRMMNVRWVGVGADFRYGHRRAGDVVRLRSDGASLGFEVETLPDVVNKLGRVSSTAVREALGRGETAAAAKMLARPYALIGRVLHGRKLGRTLGFPTANVSLTGRKPALHGVFAVKCRLVATRGLEGVASRGGVTLSGVANLGTNPVVSSENRHHLEVFLFDFSGDLYGQRLEVTFIEKIRDEMNFPGLDALVTQMHDDAARAMTILRTIDDGHKD